jgi:hypothetical protein
MMDAVRRMLTWGLAAGLACAGVACSFDSGLGDVECAQNGELSDDGTRRCTNGYWVAVDASTGADGGPLFDAADGETAPDTTVDTSLDTEVAPDVAPDTALDGGTDADGTDGCDAPRTWYLDEDGDGFGNPDETTEACSQPDGYVASGDDCDDSTAEVSPEAEEQCNEVDNNCDGVVSPGCECTFDPMETNSADTDGSNDAGVCTGQLRDSEGVCNAPDTYEEPTDQETCDGLDNDCDGTVDEGCGCTYDPEDPSRTDNDGDNRNGVCVNQSTDGDGNCSEPDTFESETNQETCDGVDNDCDGAVDEGCECTYDPGEMDNADTDGSHGNGVCREQIRNDDGICQPPANGFENRTLNETCDGIDNDCDGVIDEGCECTYDPKPSDQIDDDGSHDGGICLEQEIDSASGDCREPSGFEGSPTDDESGNSCIDGIDNDCDGVADDGCACTFDEEDSRDIDFDSDNAEGVCTGQTVDSSENCTKPTDYDGTDREGDAGNCNGLDNDCDGTIDEYCACNYTGTSTGVCSNGQIDPSTGDCDLEPAGYQATESSCDTLDNDCDGVVDEWDEVTCTTTTQTGTPALDQANDITVDGSDRIIIGGQTSGDLHGNTNSGGTWDGFVSRYESDGTRAWTTMLGSGQDDSIEGVTTDGSGNVYAVGRVGDKVGSETYSGGASDAVIAKYDNSGTRQWVRVFGTANRDKAKAVAHDGAGNLYVVGQTGAGLDGQTYNGGTYDIFVAEYDTSGNRQWLDLTGTGDLDNAAGVAADGSGTIYVSGNSSGKFGGGPPPGSGQALLLKYDSTGSQQSATQFGSPEIDTADGVAMDGAGTVYVAGSAKGAIGSQTHSGGEDAYLAEFNAGGVRQWIEQFGTSADDRIYGVAVDAAGDIHVGGFIGGQTGGQKYKGGDSDAFVAQYRSSGGGGTRQWIRLVGTAAVDEAAGLALDSGDRVFIAGETEGSFPSYTNAGSDDIFMGLIVP